MRALKSTTAEVLSNPILVGTITIVIISLAVYLSYIAENGLPYTPTYTVNIQVANADEMVKNADVRIGGARVGQVLKIVPEPATKAWPHPYARMTLAINRSLEPLPPDTRYQIRLASVLGGKYVELTPGHLKTGGIPDGGTLILNANPSLNHEIPFVDLDTAFATFNPTTRRAFQAATGEFGEAIAGRGAQLNDATAALARLMGPLQDLLGVFADPSTRLGPFVKGWAATFSALASVAPTINALYADTATTFAAFERSALGPTLDQFPATESVATTVLGRAQPVLSEAASITSDLRAGTAVLPLASQRLDEILTSATPVFRLVPKLSSELQQSLAAQQAVSRDPASRQVFTVLGSNDLATFGSSGFSGLGAILRAIAPAQFACNVAGLWTRNFTSGLTEGDTTGAWLRVMSMLDPAQGSQSNAPAGDLHLNYYPIENSSQCQAGNEAYAGAQVIGNPPQTSTVVDNTTPPPGVLARGKKAGLVP